MSIIPAHLAHLAQEPITSRRQLADYHATGAKQPDGLLIGTEHEKFVLDARNDCVPYAGPNGIHALLSGMQRFGWEPVREGETLIGLARGEASLSLEPGGQFELSGAPLRDLHAMSAELDLHFKEAGEVARELNLRFLPIGYHPTNRATDMPWMPKGRYKIMRDYMPRVGARGLEMMVLTCTTQVNLDFTDEADMARKMRIGLALQPVASALFAGSPFKQSILSPLQTNRCDVWQDVDNHRAGILPFAFEPGFGFERYVEYALNVPMYFVYRDGTYINCAGASFHDFLVGRLPQLPGEKPMVLDYVNHLTTLFPDVRLKTLIEMRGADVGRPEMIKALPALWTGLLYDKGTLDEAFALIETFTAAQVNQLRRDVIERGLGAKIGSQTALELAREMVKLAAQGLQRRAIRNGADDESLYLLPLQALLAEGKNEAERLAEKYRDEWDGSLAPLFAQAFS